MQSHLRLKTNIEIKTEKNLKKQAILIKKCVCFDAKLFTLTPASRPLKLKRCAELDGAARLRLNYCNYHFRPAKTVSRWTKRCCREFS